MNLTYLEINMNKKDCSRSVPKKGMCFSIVFIVLPCCHSAAQVEGDPYNSDPQDVSLMSEEVDRSKGPQMDDFGISIEKNAILPWVWVFQGQYPLVN